MLVGVMLHRERQRERRAWPISQLQGTAVRTSDLTRDVEPKPHPRTGLPEPAELAERLVTTIGRDVGRASCTVSSVVPFTARTVTVTGVPGGENLYALDSRLAST